MEKAIELNGCLSVVSGLSTRKVEFQNDIIGNCPAIREIYERAKKIAKYDTIVMIGGESGTGKSEIAKLIHNNSGLPGKFVTINCSAVPENLVESEFFGYVRGAFTGANMKRDGKFKEADRGTLFLDEIGDMSLSAQTKLLKAIEEGCFYPVGSTDLVKTKTRIIVASNKDLEKEVKEGRFRADLFHRINIVKIELPALRDRGSDIDGLVWYFSEKFKKKYQSTAGISTAAFNFMRKYQWPGNIRELMNVLERAFSSCEGDLIEPRHLAINLSLSEKVDPEKLPSTLSEAVDAFKRSFVIFQVRRHKGNKSMASKTMEIQRTYLSRLLSKLDITKEEIDGWDERKLFNFQLSSGGDDEGGLSLEAYQNQYVNELGMVKNVIQENLSSDQMERFLEKAANTESSKKIKELEDELSASKMEFELAEEEIGELKKTMADLEKTRFELNESNKELSTQLSLKKAEINNLSTVNFSLSAKLSDSLVRSGSLWRELSALQVTKSYRGSLNLESDKPLAWLFFLYAAKYWQKEKKHLEKVNSLLAKRAEELKNELDKLVNQLEAIRSESATNVGRISWAVGRIMELEAAQPKVLAENKQHKKLLAELVKRADEVSELEKTVRGLEQDKVNLQGELFRLQDLVHKNQQLLVDENESEPSARSEERPKRLPLDERIKFVIRVLQGFGSDSKAAWESDPSSFAEVGIGSLASLRNFINNYKIIKKMQERRENQSLQGSLSKK